MLSKTFSDTSYDGKYEVSTNYHCDAANIHPYGVAQTTDSNYSNDITDTKCQELCSNNPGKVPLKEGQNAAANFSSYGCLES